MGGRELENRGAELGIFWVGCKVWGFGKLGGAKAPAKW